MQVAPWHLEVAKSMTRRFMRQHHQVDYDAVYSDALLGLVRALRKGCVEGQVLPPMHWEMLRGLRDRSGLRNHYERPTWHGVKRAPAPEFLSLNAPAYTDSDNDAEFGDALAVRTPGPQEAAEASEVWWMVDRLPQEQRLAMRLYYGCGFSQEEVASLIGVSQMQVSRALKRARARLAETLAA